jgi:hypothetical protein
MKRSAAALLLALAAACAAPAEPASTPAPATTASTTAPAPAGTMNPVGRYEFNTIVNGQPMSGVLIVEGQPGAYTGSMESNMIPHASIKSVAVDGQQVVVVIPVPQGDVTITMNMNGDAFTGNWAIGGQTGDISGRKVS